MTENITQGKWDHFHMGKTTQLLMKNFQISINFTEAAVPVFYGGVLGLPAALPWEGCKFKGEEAPQTPPAPIPHICWIH